MGVSIAERLALEGKRVIYVTPLPSAAPYLQFTGEGRMISRLYELGVEIVSGHVVDEIHQNRVAGHLREFASRTVTWNADACVLVTQRFPRDDLFHALKNAGERLEEANISAVYRVGDCVAARPQVADAIFDGQRLAREIDSPNPMIPQPWIRESRALGTSDRDYDRVVGDFAPIKPMSEVT
jgi:dimethylamine/trimethylamine dehydrogenase